MATNSKREVELAIAVSTSGQDAVKALRDAVAALGQEGGAAAPEFQRLAEEIDKVASQQDAIDSFATLRREVANTAAELTTAAAAVDRLGAELPNAASAADIFRQAQAETKTELQSTEQLLKSARTELENLKGSYSDAGKKTDEYRVAAGNLGATIAQLKTNLKEQKDAYREIEAAAKPVVQAEKELNAEYARSLTVAGQLSSALGDKNRTLEESRVALKNVGIETTNLVEAERNVRTAFQEVRTAVEGQAAAFANLKAEEAAAAAAAQRATEDRIAQLRREEQEFERLDIIQKTTRASMEAAARQQLAVEKQVFAESAAAAQRAADAQREVARAAQESANALESAFGRVGVKSLQAIETEINQVREAMTLLSANSKATGTSLTGAFAAGESKIKALELELRELNGQLTLGDKASKLFSNSLGQIAAGNVIADGVGYLVNKVKELGREFLVTVSQMETMRRGLTAIFGSAQTAGDQIEFLRKTSQAAGVSFSGVADSFVRFSAATKSANIPLATTNELFAAVTQAGSTLGLSGERVTLVLDALGQMASKGVVSMEELRQQLGDSLPGALSLTAKGLGITDQQLVKLVESGQLAAADLFPALTKSLQQLSGDTDTLNSNWDRLKNTFTALSTGVSDAGGLVLLGGILKGLIATVGVIGGALLGLVNTLALVGRAALAVVAPFDSMKARLDFLKEGLDEAAKRQSDFSDGIDAAINPSQKLAVAYTAQATATAATTSSTLALAAAQAQQVGSTTAAGTAAVGAGNAYVQLLVSLQSNSKAVEAHIAATEKLLKAKELEGKAALQAAQISGNEVTILTAATQAAEGNARAALLVVTAREAEAAATQKTIDRITALGVANGGLREDQQKLIESLKTKLETQNASIEKSVQEQNELEATAAAARVASEAYKDNSASIDLYRQSMETLSATVPALTKVLQLANEDLATQKRLLDEGKGSQDAVDAAQRRVVQSTYDLNTARTQAATAERLYKDALEDTIKNLDLNTRAQSAALQGTLAQINAGKQHALTMEAIAKSQGNERLATEFAVQAKYKEIEAVRISAQIKELEAKSDIAGLEIKKQEIALNDPLREQKIKELDIRIQLQKVKLLEAEASKDVIQGLNEEIRAIQQASNGLAGHIGKTEEDTAARYKNVDAIKAQGAAQQKLTSDGFAANKDGSAAGSFNNSVPLDKAFSVMEKNRAGKLTAADLADAQEAVKQAKDAKAYLAFVMSQNAGAVSLQAQRETDGLLVSAQNALIKAQQQAGLAADPNARGFGGPTAPIAPQASLGNTTHKVNVVINGKSSTINAATSDDAESLSKLIQGLGNAAGTAT